MVKNRLSELQAQAKHPPILEKDEDAPLTNGDVNDFFAELESVIRDIDSLKVLINEIEKLQGKSINNTRKDETLEAEINDKINAAQKLGRSVQNVLKSLKEEDERKGGGVDVASRMKRTQILVQSKRFFDIWTSYNRNQVDFRDRCKKMLVRRCKIANNNLSDNQIEDMLDEGQTGVFVVSILDEERIAKQQLREIQDRHDEFIKLEKSIKEVHDLFVDVANLVQSQGEIVDSIYTHVISAEKDVESARGKLSDAETYAIAARKKKLCLICFGLIVLLIIVMVVLLEVGAFNGSDEAKVSTNTREIVYVYVNNGTTINTNATTEVDLIQP